MMNGLASSTPAFVRQGITPDEYQEDRRAWAGAPQQPAQQNGLTLRNPYQAPQSKFENGLLGKSLDAFQAGLDPRGREARLAGDKEAAKEKGTQTLALMKAQRNIPAEQRSQWWQQNAQQISQITGVDTSQPADPNQFTDQALDGHIATLSASLGIAPEAPEGYTLAPGAQRYEGGQMVAENPRSDKPGNVEIKEGGNGNYWEFDPAFREWRDSGVPVKQAGADGGFTLGKDQTRFDAQGNPIARGPRDPAPDPNAPPDAESIRLEREFAKDWKGVDNNFKEIDGQFKRMEALSTMAESDPKKAAAADLGLLVSFTKMLDPGSVAREGEVKLTQSAASLVDQVAIWLPRLQNGNTLLPPDLRKAYLEAAREMYGTYANAYQNIAQDYRATAQAYRFDPDRVMMGYRGPEPKAPAGDKPDLDAMLSQAPAFVQRLFRGDSGQTPQSSSPVRITSDDEYEALPPGTDFIDPDGELRTKP